MGSIGYMYDTGMHFSPSSLQRFSIPRRGRFGELGVSSWVCERGGLLGGGIVRRLRDRLSSFPCVATSEERGDAADDTGQFWPQR